MTYLELFAELVKSQMVLPRHVPPFSPAYPPWYDEKAQCEYHAGVKGHTIENCTAFKRVVDDLRKSGMLSFENSEEKGNSLSNH
ncbi:hypothetical protein HRI_002970800 [Hibiscus trionum]|uniref:Gag-pol polyprotein n=1 Tax=Hibiscus trionum TaxID=183268 RepID=A0A9W7IAV8_HIBTR|nr:hypothetical protein HRI_002970800 [Hibiscus trionum]